MKRLFTIIAAVLLTATIWAQNPPQKMSYQAVIRNSSDQLVKNNSIGMRITILQGSPTGTVVYTETQIPITNANGLVTTEIGGGTGFSSIDWSAGPYFLKTETDPAGGTNYTITGTTQLLSVPYALHAKTAETVTGGITETDPLWSVSPLFGITSTSISNWNTSFSWGNHSIAGYLTSFTETDPAFTSWDKDFNDLTNKPTLFSGSFVDLTNKPITIAGYGITDAFSGSYTDLTNKPTNATTTADGFMSSTDKTKLNGLQNVNITAGTEISVTGTYPDITIATTSPIYTIGLNEDLGGYIFYVTPDGRHGLVAATQDQSTSYNWYLSTNCISNPANHNTAGKKYTDWRLPTYFEFDSMYNQKTNIGGFISGYYWSSSETNYNRAWCQDFGNGNKLDYDKSTFKCLRAVRDF